MDFLSRLSLLATAPLLAVAKTSKSRRRAQTHKRKSSLGARRARRAKSQPRRAARTPVRQRKPHPRTAARQTPRAPQKPVPKVVIPPSPPAAAEPPAKPMAPIGRALLLSPENEKFADSLYPTFRWLSVGGATRYEIAWSEDSNFVTSHSIFSIATEATVPVEKPLRAGATYYWRVRGGNASGWGVWSATASFRVLAEAT